MTRLRMAFSFVAVVAGDYAILTLIDGQLTDFGISATVCAGSTTAAGLIAYADRQRRKAARRGRAAVWERRDTQAAADQQCPLCGGAGRKQSDSPRFVDRQRARYAGNARRLSTPSRHDESAAGLGAIDMSAPATVSGSPPPGLRAPEARRARRSPFRAGAVVDVTQDGPSMAGRIAWLSARLLIRPTLSAGSACPPRRGHGA